MSLQPGSHLGTYEITSILGAGGMGEVYRARDRKLGREVAIKVLPEEFSSDPARVSRFEREARMLAAVNHPTIAAIYGAEEDGEQRYIVMELVEGDTLAQRLATGALPVADALRIAAQTAEALEVAHEKGVIHRDLKPANIKITPTGKVKVLDFGLAKAMDLPFAGDMSRSPTLVMDESRPGEIVGTPEFMSPEQARGKDTDRRTDVWSFGCILFEMLSGRRAFTGETVTDALAAILHNDPDWTLLPVRTPQRIRDLLLRCLEKDPGRRLRDAGDARLEIEAALAGLSAASLGPPPSQRHRSATVPLLLAAIVVSGAAVLLWTRSRPPAAGGRVRQLAVLPFRNLTNSREGEAMGLGMAETVSARLANVPGLQVVTPRASVEAADTESNFARVARRLGANTLLTGSLQRENDRYRITYRLVDAGGRQIAANAIDGTEIFALQDRLADTVQSDLRLPKAARPTALPSGLDTPSEQERYVQAVGLLQRYDRRDSVESALSLLRQLAQEKPASPLVQAALGRANLAMFDFTKEREWADRAFAAAESATGLDPGRPEVNVVRGETLLAAGRAPEAVASFHRALAVRPGDVDSLLGLGRASQAAGDDAAADRAFRRAAELQPSFAVFNQLGALYAARGHWSEAAGMFRKATEVAPDSYRAWSNLGGVETMRCNFGAALVGFKQATRLAPNDPIIASNLGLTQLWTGNASEAVINLEAATRRAPYDFQVWGNLGDALRETGAKQRAAEAYGRSILLAREALKLNPAAAEAHSFLATGLAKTGRPDEAADEIKRAVALGDKDPNLLADAAVIAAAAGRNTEALGWLRKAVAAGYCPSIIARQPEFATLRESPEFRSIIAAPRGAAG